MISPTGSTRIRSDSMGGGHFGAARGRRKHAGADYTVTPGAHIVAPIDGRVTRIAKPYADQPYSGLVIESPAMAVKMFYFEPLDGIVGQEVKEGMVIGHAQDISKLHGEDMIPHIHLQIDRVSMDPADWITD